MLDELFAEMAVESGKHQTPERMSLVAQGRLRRVVSKMPVERRRAVIAQSARLAREETPDDDVRWGPGFMLLDGGKGDA
jgi:hypothetical protein